MTRWILSPPRNRSTPTGRCIGAAGFTTTRSGPVTRLKFSAPLAVPTDGEEHARLRKQVQPGFSKGAMDSWWE
jgi:cytochrome P450